MRVKKIVVLLIAAVCCWQMTCAMSGGKKGKPGAATELTEACKLKTTPRENAMCIVQEQLKACNEKIKRAQQKDLLLEQKTKLLNEIIGILCQDITQTAFEGIRLIQSGEDAEITTLEQQLIDLKAEALRYEASSREMVKSTSKEVLLKKLETTRTNAVGALENLRDFKDATIEESDRNTKKRSGMTDEQINADLKKLSEQRFETVKNHAYSALYSLCATLDAIGSFNSSITVGAAVQSASDTAKKITLLSHEDPEKTLDYLSDFNNIDINKIQKQIGG